MTLAQSLDLSVFTESMRLLGRPTSAPRGPFGWVSAKELTTTMSSRRRDFLLSGRPQDPGPHRVCHPCDVKQQVHLEFPHPPVVPSGREILRTERLKWASGTFLFKCSF